MLTDIKELESTKYSDDDGNPSKYRLWIFKVLSPKKFKGEEIAGSTSMFFSPNAKARKWCETLVGRKLEEGERVEFEDLTDKPVHLNAVPNKDGSKMFVDAIFPLPEEEEGEAQEALEKQTEEDLDSIPF